MGLSASSFLNSKIKSDDLVKFFFTKKTVYLNFVSISGNQILKNRDLVQIFLLENEKTFFNNESKLKIIHSENDFFIIEKSSGVNSVIDTNNLQNNVHYLLNEFLQLSETTSLLFAVHRLDKLTSGLMIVAKTLNASKQLIQLFKDKQIEKKYWAIVAGHFDKKEFIISAPLKSTGKNKQALIGFAGRKALTKFKIIKETKNLSLLECQPITGRTHQIRSHLKFVNHPVINDHIYGGKKANFIFLHSFQISFKDWNSKNKMNFYSSFPKKFQNKLNV